MLVMLSETVACGERLTDCATHELRLFDSYNGKLEQARTARRIAGNCSSAVASINTIPAEILGQIFDLVLRTQPRVGEKIKGAPVKPTRNPI